MVAMMGVSSEGGKEACDKARHNYTERKVNKLTALFSVN